ncbi:RNA-binding protein 39-like isoform X2 [Symsagittifera roscoffensis]|uniref:RNA-binding protein 39-like isoform X2 n=1 Tax=Symsagittifera roscoffensis TaxID=84072 RepID=UPI00307CB216
MDDMVESLLESAFAEKPRKRSRSKSPRGSRYERNNSRRRSRERSPKDRIHARERDGNRERSHRNYGITPSSSKYSPPPRDDKSQRKERSTSRDRIRKEKDHERRRRSRSGERKHGAAPPQKDLPARVKALHDSGEDPEFAELLSQEDKDSRTVFCMQLSPDITARDLRDFFRHCGRIVDVRIIGERSRHKSRSSKGVAYIEFDNINAVPKAVNLSGRKILGIPIVVQQSQAEKNRIYCNTSQTFHGGYTHGPTKVMVSNLHPQITQEMLGKVFKPYGSLDHVELMKDVSGDSKEYGFVFFNEKESSEKAISQLNGFTLVGRKLRVSLVNDPNLLGTPSLDNEDMDRRGIELGPTGRISLMAKLAKSCGMDIPDSAKNILSGASHVVAGGAVDPALAMPTVPTNINLAFLAPRSPGPGVIPSQCLVLSNMFGSDLVMSPEVIDDITEEVLVILKPYGGALHVHVDKDSPQGNIFVKSVSIAQGEAAVNALHKKEFSGREIDAAFIQFTNYHSVFPQSANVSKPLKTRRSRSSSPATKKSPKHER